MAEREMPVWLRKIKIPVYVLGGLVLLYAVLGFWLIPYLIKSKLPEILEEELNRTGSIQEVSINPFLFEVDLKGFEIQRKQGGRFVGFDDFFINFEMSSLFKRAVTFDEVRLTGLFVEIDKLKNGSFNFDDLLESSGDDEAEPEEDDSDPFPVWITKLEIESGNVVFNDQSRKTPFRTEISPIDFSVVDFHTYLDGGSQYQFKANFDSGGSLDWQGDLNVTPLRSKGRIKLSEFKPILLWQYIQDTVNFSITGGAFKLDAQYDVHMRGDSIQVVVSKGEYVLENLKIAQKGSQEPVIDIPRLALDGIAFNLLEQKVSIETFSSENASIHGWVRPDKEMNFVELFSPVQGNQPAKPVSSSAEASPSGSEWLITVKKIALNGYGFLFEDRSLATTMRLDFKPLNISVQDFSSDMKGKLPFSIQSAVNKTGHLNVGGDLGLDPLSTDVKLDLKLNLTDFQPYIDPVTKLEFGKGDVIVKGDVNFSMDESGKPQLGFNGMANIDDFIGQDKVQKKKLLDWKALRFDGVDFNLDPMKVAIKEVTADKAFTRFIIHSDGTTNFSKVFSGEASGDEKGQSGAAPDKGAEKASDPIIKIDKVTIKNTSALFADRSLKPKFATSMEGLNGSIKGLSTAKNSRAKIDLKGTADKTAPLRIKGQVNVFNPDRYTDIGLDFKNLSLTSLTPYSGKFAGYKIEKGKLSMDLKYTIKKKKLAAENKIVIDQLTLGDEVDSPDAVSLPLSLAIALLKDADGVIDIDLPLKGSLDDPQFSIWGIVGDVLMNMITKVVTSPFAALGSLVGDDEALDNVGFGPGQSEITADQKEKLGQVVEALAQRPALKLEIEGVAAEVDAEQQFRNTILAAKKSALVKSAEEDQSDTPQPAPTLSDEEYKRYLLQAYYKKIAGMNSLSLNAPTINQQLNSDEVLKSARRKVYGAMLAEDGTLRDLAHVRGLNIREYLIAQGLNADRIFLLDVNLESNDESQPGADELVLSKLALNAD